MLRAVQMGLSIADMELLTFGLILDMIVESLNDEADADEGGATMRATQADFDRF